MAKRKSKATENKEARERIRELIRQARSGEKSAAWLDKVIRQEGYGDPPGDEVIVSTRALEKGLNLSRRQIQEYFSEGMPRRSAPHGNKAATVEVWECMRWMREFWKRVHTGGLEESDAIRMARESRKAKLLREQSDAQIKQAEAGLKLGRLVDRDKVEVDVNNLLLLLKVRVENMPAEIAAESVGKKMDEIAECARVLLQTAWNSAIEELRKLLPAKPKVPELPIGEDDETD